MCVCVCVTRALSLSLCLSVHPSASLSVWLSVLCVSLSLCVCLSVCLCVCVSVSLSLSPLLPPSSSCSPLHPSRRQRSHEKDDTPGPRLHICRAGKQRPITRSSSAESYLPFPSLYGEHAARGRFRSPWAWTR